MNAQLLTHLSEINRLIGYAKSCRLGVPITMDWREGLTEAAQKAEEAVSKLQDELCKLP